MNSDRHQSQASRRTDLLICIGLAALIWAVFGQTCGFDFVNYDDPSYVYQNPAITSGLNWPAVKNIFSHFNVGTWFPLTDLSHQCDWQIYGSNPGGHHLTNVLLHLGATLLLFFAWLGLTGARWHAALVAALFAIHPLRAESVAWVVERKDVLSGMFFALTLCAWVRHLNTVAARPSRSGITTGYALALLFFVLGLMAKSMLVTLPCVLLLLDYWPANRLDSGAPLWSREFWRSVLKVFPEKIPFFVASGIFCVVTLSSQHVMVDEAGRHTLAWRVANAIQALADYIYHGFYPVGLAVAYPLNAFGPEPARTGLAAFVLFAMTIAVFAGRRRYPYLLTGWGWYLIMLLPVIDIMQSGRQARADRFTYLPQIGLVVLCVWGAADFWHARRWQRSMAAGIAAAVLLTLATAAYFQTGYWRNSEALWKRSLACNRDNAFAWNYLGSDLFNSGRHAEARRYFQKAVQLQPDYPDALVNLGMSSADLGQRTNAIALFRQALRINPASPEAHYNLGDSLAEAGNFPEAIGEFQAALQFKPDYPGAEYDLGLSLARSGHWDEAAAHYQTAFRIPISAADTRYITGVALAVQTNWDAAIPLYETALELNTSYAEAHYRLAIALAAKGEKQSALEHLQQAKTLAVAQRKDALLDGINEEFKKIADGSRP
ncbi:MAG TPA: tetratricopeptide repeat protein [Candidatus Sulfotelmatobacter sp.]|nr:tetratricopeptide repeat protein [Candidatus Sulfotelmatobacter sp.]